MPRHARVAPPRLAEKTLVIDNGAYEIKAGFSHELHALDTGCLRIPNCIAKAPHNKRIWVGADVEQCTDFAEMVFRRPHQKGYLVGWEFEREIWDQIFFDKGAKLYCEPTETNLILTEAPNAPSNLQSNCDQIVFEEFEFASYLRATAPALNAYNDVPSIFGDSVASFEQSTTIMPSECLLVVDSGYSHTTVTPLYKGRPIQQAVRRLEVGGRLLTNYLKDMISIRQMDVRDETHMIDLMKRDVCFVSQNFRTDLESTWKHAPRKLSNGHKNHETDAKQAIVLDYVFPDYTPAIPRGFARPHDPSLRKQMSKAGIVTNPVTGNQECIAVLGNERFTVPELLFNPSDIGLNQPGLPEMIMQSMKAVPTGLWSTMLGNVLLVGGNVKIEGFKERLTTELRPLVPNECPLRVQAAKDVIKSTWLGGARLAEARETVSNMVVTRQEYLENGATRLARRFAGDAG